MAIGRKGLIGDPDGIGWERLDSRNESTERMGKDAPKLDV